MNIHIHMNCKTLTKGVNVMLNHVLIWGQGIYTSTVGRQKEIELHVAIIPTFPTK